MGFDRNSAYVLILCSIPLHFNLYSDSMSKMLNGLMKGWKSELTYYENYFADKITGYVGIVGSILFIFIYYHFQKLRLIISILFYCSAVTWILYLGVKENTVFLLLIIRTLQGIYQNGLHIAHFTYIMHFADQQMICFYGCLTQFSMFTGLLLENLLFSFVSWNAATIIFFIESAIFGSLIWLVPDISIKPKSVTKEYLHQKDNLKAIIISSISMMLQLLSGIGIMLNSLSKMLSGIGLNIPSTLESCLFDFVGALANLIAAFIIDSLSTKFMFCFSAFGLFVGLLMYSLSLKIKMANWIGALAVFVYFLFYGLGLGPIPWYLFSTMIPESCRIESAAIGTALNLFLPGVLDYIWNGLDKLAGQFGSSIFGAIDCLIAIIFGLIFMPHEHYKEEEDTINLL